MQQSGLMHRFLLTRFLHRRHTAAVIAFRPDGNLQRQHCILFSRQKQTVFSGKQGLQEKHKKMMRGHLMFFFIHSIKKIGRIANETQESCNFAAC